MVDNDFVLTQEDFDKLSATLREDWMKAEEVLKIVERMKNEAFLPSINELRYAGRRYVQAEMSYLSKSENDWTIHVHLIEAIENCKKARHDCIDSAINFIHERIETTTMLAGYKVVMKKFPHIGDIWKEIEDIDRRIIKSRKDRKNIDDEYENIKRTHLKKVVNLYLDFKKTGLDIIADNKKTRNSIIATITSTVIGALILGVTASLIAAFIYDRIK